MSSRQLSIRVARPEDAPEIEALQHDSMRHLGAAYYTPAQIESGLRHIGTYDPRLIADGTYYVAAFDGELVGCGGWSYRAARFGGDGGARAAILDPATDAARIRALYVHPEWAGRGIARRLMATAEAAARAAGFRRFELVSTLTAERLYRGLGYREVDRIALSLPGGVTFQGIEMEKAV
jgi:predicted N-acetyltransferase YhbS